MKPKQFGIEDLNVWLTRYLRNSISIQKKYIYIYVSKINYNTYYIGTIP